MANECSSGLYPDNSWTVLRLKEFLKNKCGRIQGKISLKEQFYQSIPSATQLSTRGKKVQDSSLGPLLADSTNQAGLPTSSPNWPMSG